MLDVSGLSEPAFTVDDAHRIVAWNDGAERLLGLRADEVIGRRCYEALAVGDSACYVVCQQLADGSRAPAARNHHGLFIAVRDEQAPGETRRVGVTALAAHNCAGKARVMHLLQGAPAETLAEPEPEPAGNGALPLHHSALGRAAEPGGRVTPLADAAESGSRIRRPELLTQRELEVLRLLGAGYSTDNIAHELSITRVTARNHVNRVLDKLGANSRLQAVVIASQLQLI